MADNTGPQPTPEDDLPFIDLGDDDPVQPEGVYLDDEERERRSDYEYKGSLLWRALNDEALMRALTASADEDADEDPDDRLYEGNDPDPKWWLIRYYRGESFGNEDWLMDQDR